MPVSPAWIVDHHMASPLHGGTFLATLRDMQRSVIVLDDQHVYHQRPLPEIAHRERCLLYGSLPTVRILPSTSPHIATFGPGEAFTFSSLAARLPRQMLLSADYRMEVLGQLLREDTRQTLCQALGEEIFVRPDSGSKTFAGQVIQLSSANDIEALVKSHRLAPETRGIMASRRDIMAEYRLFMSRRHGPVAWSCYSGLHRDHALEASEVPGDVIDHAERVGHCLNQSGGAPDEIYVLDLARTAEGLAVIEVNAASTSGLYGCDAKPIIIEMERIIQEEDTV